MASPTQKQQILQEEIKAVLDLMIREGFIRKSEIQTPETVIVRKSKKCRMCNNYRHRKSRCAMNKQRRKKN